MDNTNAPKEARDPIMPAADLGIRRNPMPLIRNPIKGSRGMMFNIFSMESALHVVK
jgi:hypothetical protein